MSVATTIASVDEIAEGKGKAFDLGEKRIAIFNVAEKKSLLSILI